MYESVSGATFRFIRQPARSFGRPRAEPIHPCSEFHRRPHKVVDFQSAQHFYASYPMKTCACSASALRAIGISTENARLNPASKIRRIVSRHFCKQTVARIRGWMQESACQTRMEYQFGIPSSQFGQISRKSRTIFRSKHLSALLADLRRVSAHPNAIRFRPAAPERHVLLEVASALEHGLGDRPVNIHLASVDILEDAVVSGGLPPNIVMLGQAVH